MRSQPSIVFFPPRNKALLVRSSTALGLGGLFFLIQAFPTSRFNDRAGLPMRPTTNDMFHSECVVPGAEMAWAQASAPTDPTTTRPIRTSPYRSNSFRPSPSPEENQSIWTDIYIPKTAP